MPYDVFALRYGTQERTKTKDFFRWDLSGEPDTPSRMDFYFWLARSDDHVVPIDCGFDEQRGAVRGFIQTRSPVELLDGLGVKPADVDHVIASHMHLDHVGNLGLFDRASVTVSRREFEFWTSSAAHHEALQCTVEPKEISHMADLLTEGRLNLIDEQAEVVPGIRVVDVGGHSPGQLLTHVEGTGSTVVIASDAMHYYEEMEHDRPFSFFVDLPALYQGYETLRRLADETDTRVVAGHDPAVMERFPAVAPDCARITDACGSTGH